MEAYLSENVPTIEYFYIGHLCSKPRDAFSPKEDVVEGQMLIVQSPKWDYAIWLDRENGSVFIYLDVSIDSYKVEIQWWKPMGTSKDLMELYRNCLNENQQ